MLPTTITTTEALHLHLNAFRKFAPEFTPVVDDLGPIPLRYRPPGFEGMCEIVIGQQVSKASANAIFSRFKKTIRLINPENYLQLNREELVATGLSRAKQICLHDLATRMNCGALDLEELCQIDEFEAVDKLCEIKGIGLWSAEVFLLFCAGHLDIFPAGDVALRTAIVQILDEIDGRKIVKLDIKQARQEAEKWAPFRSILSRILYAYYSKMKGRTEIPV